MEAYNRYKYGVRVEGGGVKTQSKTSAAEVRSIVTLQLDKMGCISCVTTVRGVLDASTHTKNGTIVSHEVMFETGKVLVNFSIPFSGKSSLVAMSIIKDLFIFSTLSLPKALILFLLL